MATAITRREMDFVSRVRDANRKLWDAENTLLALQAEWNALDYGSTLGPEVFEDGEHEGLAGADVGSVVFATADAIKTLLNTGHATNMAKLL